MTIVWLKQITNVCEYLCTRSFKKIAMLYYNNYVDMYYNIPTFDG